MKTAMQQLLTQMREERNKLPMPIEWDRAYQAIEMMIEHTYIPLEKEHICMAYNDGRVNAGLKLNRTSEEYYNETYNK